MGATRRPFSGGPWLDPTPPENPFPLAVSENGRYLVTQQGTPFAVNGDSGWFIPVHLGETDQNTYLDYIVEAGYNATNFMNIVSGAIAIPQVNEPADADGVQPFTTANDIRTPNNTYFLKIKDYISRAEQRGIVACFHCCYNGWGGGEDGWQEALTNRTNGECFNFGVYLGTMFDNPNILWMFIGDYNVSGTALTRWQNLVAGIQSVTRNRLCGGELNAPDDIMQDQSGFTCGIDPATSDFQLGCFYGWAENGVHLTALEQWDASPSLPAQSQEPRFYDDPNTGSLGREPIRCDYHWCRTSGAHSSMMGVNGRWQGIPIGREDEIASPANWTTNNGSAVDLDRQRAHAFYGALEWWRLIPSGTATGRAGRNLIVSGGGSNTTQITSSIADNGTLLVAYVPNTGTGTRAFNVDLRSMADNSRARWWNPTSGAYTDITGGAYSLSNSLSSQAFTTPGNNGTGTNDWILILDTES